MYKCKVGMIGLGNWGRNIYRNLMSFNVLEKVYDKDLNSLSNFIDNKNKISGHVNDIISSKNIDCVVIASPAPTHKEYIIRSLLNKKNVFVEKPLCLSLNDALEIKKVSLDVNKLVFTGHLLNYHNGFSELKKNVEAGLIGKLKIIKANRMNFGAIRKKESVLYDLTSHDISMILSITKKIPNKIEVNAIFENSKKIADYINVILYFDKNIIAILSSDWISPYKEHRFSVYGSKGSLVFDDTRNWQNKLTFNPSYLSKNCIVNYNPIKNISIKEEEPLKKEIKTFLNCVENSKKPKTDIDEAVNVQIVLDMIEKELIRKYG
tara:strand:+ start:3089 stop:4051 length:963 start_codon:yes stop_codon:yes gene_type:complete